MPVPDTLLSLSSMGVAIYSARGLTQTLEPIRQSAQLSRTINGDAIDLSETQFQKYFSSISCTDFNVPALDGIWPGMELTVDCVAELCYGGGTGGSASRSAVSGSERTSGDFTFYRPQLSMRVVSYRVNVDEYGASAGWTLDLEEV
jgi:hypothetical protein